MRTMNCVRWLAVVIFLAGVSSSPAATWYVDSDNGSPGDGLSWGAAFTEIKDAMAALAATNATDGFNGGHLVLVTNGPYVTDATSHEFDPSHNGVNGSPNVFRALGRVVVDSSADSQDGVFDFDGTDGSTKCTDITIDGFTVVPVSGDYSCWHGVRILEYSDRIQILNTVVAATYFSDDRHHFYIGRDCDNCVISNCVAFGGAQDSGFRVYARDSEHDTIVNCISVGHRYYGFDLYQYSTTSSDIRVLNCITYGNAYGGIGVYLSSTTPTVYTTHDEVSADISINCFAITNCIAKNPGFADISNDWNFNAFFANSPAKNSATDGGWIGAYQNPTEVPVSADTWYVATDGNDSTGDGSESNPWATIGKATGVAGPGDTVMVAAGTYEEAVVITNGGSGDLGVTYEADGTVLIKGAKACYLNSVVGVTMDGFNLEGITQYGLHLKYSSANFIRNFDITSNWACIYKQWSANNTFEDCDAHDSTYIGMQGMSGGPGGCIFRRCRFYNNGGAGVDTGGLGDRFEECEIFGNGDFGAGFGTSRELPHPGGHLYNCLIYSNASHGVLSKVDSSQGSLVQMYNCTVYGNGGDGARSDWYMGGYNHLAYNCIIAGNDGYGINELSNETRTSDEDWHVVNCLFWDNGATGTDHFRDTTYISAGLYSTNVYSTAAEIDSLVEPVGSCTNNIVGNPLFVSLSGNDYRLKPGSPAIDAGDASLIAGLNPEYGTTWTLTSDKVDNPRTKGAAPDIGAYEWQPWAGTIMLIR